MSKIENGVEMVWSIQDNAWVTLEWWNDIERQRLALRQAKP